MAAGGITSLPALPEDGGGAFPPGHFKDPKRLYCKNGGFFLRIHPDGRVDGVREKSDPHGKLPPLTRVHGLEHTAPSPPETWDSETRLPLAPRQHRGPRDTGKQLHSCVLLRNRVPALHLSPPHPRPCRNSRWTGLSDATCCSLDARMLETRDPRLLGAGGRRVSLASCSHPGKQRQDEVFLG